MRPRRAILVVSALLAISTFAMSLGARIAEARTNWAILVGVSDYPGLDEGLQLKGPANDVALARAYLKANPAAPFDDEHIIVLADGVEGAGEPTLANIRSAFSSLTGKVAAGDFVYLHFAGHGSQAPAANPEGEPDGLDELFLPKDIGPWKSSVGEVENSLTDNEIGRLIDGLLAKDAAVWAVFDSCHSGTVTRGAPTGGEDVRTRKIDPVSLGIPRARLDEAEGANARGLPPSAATSAMVDADPANPHTGALVAFYAAQSNQTTPEMRLPAGKKGRQSHGLFTWTIFEVLAEHPGLTYRQLGQEVLRRYGAKYMVQPTPLFDGNLDRAVFDIGPTDAVRQWPIASSDGELRIAAGQLHQLAEGDLLALVDTPAAMTDAAIGFLEVTSASALSSVVRPVESGGKPALAPEDIVEGFYARRVEARLDFAVNVALPAGDAGTDEARAMASAVLARLGDAAPGLRLNIVSAGEAADVRLALIGSEPVSSESADPSLSNHLWLLPPTGDLILAGPSKSPSIDLVGKTAEEAASALADSLTRMARATNLMKLGEAFSGNGLDVSIELQTRNRTQPRLASLDAASVPRLVPGDEIHVRAQNRMDVPVDMNVLYVGSDYSITHIYAGRILPGDTFASPLLRITTGSFGRERVILVLSPAKPQTAVEDLRFLAQDAVPVTRGGPGSLLRNSLVEAGFGSRTRGAAPLVGPEEGPAGAIVQFDLETSSER